MPQPSALDRYEHRLSPSGVVVDLLQTANLLAVVVQNVLPPPALNSLNCRHGPSYSCRTMVGDRVRAVVQIPLHWRARLRVSHRFAAGGCVPLGTPQHAAGTLAREYSAATGLPAIRSPRREGWSEFASVADGSMTHPRARGARPSAHAVDLVRLDCEHDALLV